MRAPADVLRIGAILLVLSVGVGGQNALPIVDQRPIAGAASTGLRTLLLQGDDEPVRAIVRGGGALDGGDVATLHKAAGTKAGEGITIQFHDGDLKARVEDKDSHERYKRTLF